MLIVVKHFKIINLKKNLNTFCSEPYSCLQNYIKSFRSNQLFSKYFALRQMLIETLQKTYLLPIGATEIFKPF